MMDEDSCFTDLSSVSGEEGHSTILLAPYSLLENLEELAVESPT